ncbi:efflux RND transporter periplasmic adaptor subunit [Phenylobacterium sp.]|uniref:efflux RND transporter periplasmic adaptor subunit n=1 Tax=Phenylobacterium sp. TaxID=1871053 RepID=UPI002B7FC45E|nr:efflux RND transporter periplasmic adaptor subunit [Phenylobacterium sp.]HVI32028.1 efflux RND transporter periplasmic adaptor subunit [Phenylobacterium sp.]
MTPARLSRPAQLGLAAAAIALVAGAAGFGAARLTPSAPQPTPAAAEGRQILYWYDPMLPAERYPGPGKSSMGMELIPKYADEAAASAGVRIDPERTQNLGVRLAVVERGTLPGGLAATGVIGFSERDVAVVQARTAGFVQRVYARAPGDLIGAGAPLADILVPEWAGAQGEFLAVKRTGDAGLVAAARQRLQLLGMPPSLIVSVERSGRVRNVVTVSTPSGGVIRTLGVRQGMTVAAGQTLAEVNGLGRVWLDAAVPEAQASQLQPGQAASATLAAYPGETFHGRVSVVLPEAQAQTRTLTARIELPNTDGRLRPGMFASVQFGGAERPALLVPTEALVRTGRRTLVMVARDGGRYLPAEVRTGREGGGRTEILSGLAEGEKVVASGQFLIDSEASLAGVTPRAAVDPPPAAPAPPPRTPAPPKAQAPATPGKAPAGHIHEPAPARTPAVLHRSQGRVEQVSAGSVTLSHDPIASLGWPAMTMAFPLARPGLAAGLQPGDRIAFSVEETAQGPLVRELSKGGV